MSTMATEINPDMLVWAREQQGLALGPMEAVFPKIELWEAGIERPTMNQLRDLARRYRRPSALFFLEVPPAAAAAVTDFRRYQGGEREPLSPEARSEIRVCEARRKRAIELADGLDVATAFGLPPLSPETDIEAAAASIRVELGLDAATPSLFKKDVDYLDFWIARIEEKNALVFRSISLSSFNESYKELRGTSAWYDDYPWILVNSQEHEHAQLFTLVHELAHLLLRGGGICDLSENETGDADTERFCNAFAAALLLPRVELLRVLADGGWDWGDREDADRGLARITKLFHVSPEAAARRLLSLGTVDRDFYRSTRERQFEDLDRFRSQKREEEGGDGRYYFKRVLKWNGRSYSSLVLESYHREKLSLGEASRHLGAKVEHLERIERELYG